MVYAGQIAQHHDIVIWPKPNSGCANKNSLCVMIERMGSTSFLVRATSFDGEDVGRAHSSNSCCVCFLMVMAFFIGLTSCFVAGLSVGQRLQSCNNTMSSSLNVGGANNFEQRFIGPQALERKFELDANVQLCIQSLYLRSSTNASFPIRPMSVPNKKH